MTWDTGALIALENGDKRMRIAAQAALARGLTITVPAPVVAEWWRGGRGQRKLLTGLSIESTTPRLARLAGQALVGVAGPSAVDAIVMASAALRGDVVFTADLEDLQQLQTAFPGVRLFRA